MTDVVHIKPGDLEAGCDIHEWPIEGIALRLMAAMRETHGKGGVNACRPCIDRVYEDRDVQRGKVQP